MAFLLRWRIRLSVSRQWGLHRRFRVQDCRCLSLPPHRSSCNDVATVSCAADGKKMKVTWDDGEESTFHAVWLRHNCQCSECVQHSSGQKLVTSVELSGSLRISETRVQENTVDIGWFSDGRRHRGYLNLSWLRENSYSASSQAKRKERTRPLVAVSLPELHYSEVVHSDEGIWTWLRYIVDYGLCLLKGIPTNQGEIKKVAERIGPVQQTLHTEVFDILGIGDARPVTIANSSLPLCFHMDESAYESPPGLQLLHCIRNDRCVEGGKNVLLDSLPLLDKLKVEFPQHFDTLARVPATFQNTAYSQRGQLAAPPPDLRYQRPHITVDSGGRVIGFTWNPLLEGPLCVPEEDVEPYFEAYHCLGELMDKSEFKIVHRLQPGEALTFNNRRVMHKRSPIELNGGVRHLQGVYMNIDTFKSKFQVLTSQLHPEYPVRHVFNQCNW